jgi:uncharacterized membrane protein YhhN
VLSDSVLAINLFVLKNAKLGLIVMGTYAAAQYLIVRGALATSAVEMVTTGKEVREKAGAKLD